MSKMQLQFRIYMQSLKLPLKVIMAVYLANIIISMAINAVVLKNHDFFSTMGYNTALILLNFILGLLVAIPVVNFNMFNLFLGFGMTRKRYYINMSVFNLLVCFALTLLMTFVYFTLSFMLRSGSKILYVMGFASVDHRLGTIFLFALVCFSVFLVIASLNSLICSVFHSKGGWYGLSALLVALSIPVLFIRQIYDFVVWGGAAALIGTALLAASLGASYLAWRFVSGLEIHT